jgi:hypothetical protein
VEFVSDHEQFAGAAAAMAANPRRAGDGLVAAPALEAWFARVHVVLLGVTPADRVLLASPKLDTLLPAAVRDGRLSRAPIAIATLPDRVLPFLRRDRRDGFPFVRALELVDGAPRALAQSDGERGELTARGDALGLVPVASSNHHGWGRTAVAWTLVRVPGWRAMTPDSLTARIVDVLRRGDRGAVRVVERERPVAADAGAKHLAALALTVPTLGWQTLASLEPEERVVWLAWVWGLALAARLGARVRRPETAARRVALVTS